MVESAVDSDHTATVVESSWTSYFLSDLAFSNPVGKSFFTVLLHSGYFFNSLPSLFSSVVRIQLSVVKEKLPHPHHTCVQFLMCR